MNAKGVVFVALCVVALYVVMGYRAQHALERAVCGSTRDYVCLKLRKTDARRALHVAWWTWPWTLGTSEEDLKANFVRHFL
jgi:hypothetical protein